MGKKAKVGKSRKDRFYHLAKETGYRSRASFKLIQLNRKFEFLQKSNVIVDLCAAPGGWLQVAAENAPMSNHIIGIDLDPIQPIKNVKTLQEDITTEKCRQAIKKQLHTVKADLFLNDGAPNVGKNWLNDAYQQAELTLYALKLATEFLRKGGWFVTKIFRSKDYDSLMWVFQQLFKNVHATKPQASRNESAEIFVVCQNFIAPDKIDPKFLNPKYAFKEVKEDAKPLIDLIHPAKKRRHREGYPEDNLTLSHSLSATAFFASSDFMNLLACSTEIKLDSEEIENHPLTTTEIKECLKDIRLLGKKELKSIFSWRKKIKKDIEDNEVAAETAEKEDDGAGSDNEAEMKEAGEDSEDEELNAQEKEIEEMQKLLEERNLQELKEMKKAKKKVKKVQLKQKTRIDLKMAIPGDKIDIEGDINMFDIKRIKNRKQLSEIEKGDLSHMDAEDMFDDSDEDKAPRQKLEYFERGEKKYIGAGEDTDEESEMEEEPSFDDDEDEDKEDSDEEEEENGENANPLLIDLGHKKKQLKANEDTWFSKSAFADLEKDADEDVELGQMGLVDSEKKRRSKKRKLEKDEEEDSDDDDDDTEDDDDNDEEEEENDQSDDKLNKNGDSSSDDDDDDDSSDDGDNSDYDYMEANSLKNKKKGTKRDNVPSTAKPDKNKKVAKFDGIEVVPAAVPNPDLQLDAEGLAIGAAMVQSKKRRREVIDSGYHRFMYDDDNLPDWFEEDEKRHTQRQMPVTKAEVEEYKLKTKAIDAQPIKKIAEAKARKKKRTLKSLEKARKKANTISDNVDVSEKEKWNQIKHVYKKAGLLKKAKESVTYVRSKKGAGKKVSRPAGVKGKFKVVDGRMKKDMRGEKRAEARNQKKSGKNKGTAKGGNKRSRR